MTALFIFMLGFLVGMLLFLIESKKDLFHVYFIPRNSIGLCAMTIPAEDEDEAKKIAEKYLSRMYTTGYTIEEVRKLFIKV